MIKCDRCQAVMNDNWELPNTNRLGGNCEECGDDLCGNCSGGFSEDNLCAKCKAKEAQEGFVEQARLKAQAEDKVSRLQEVVQKLATEAEDTCHELYPFGLCLHCGYELNSELVSEYEVEFCPKCGAKLDA